MPKIFDRPELFVRRRSVIGTPINEDLHRNVETLLRAVDTHSAHLNPSELTVLRSTVLLGTRRCSTIWRR